MSPSESARKLKTIRTRAIGLRELARLIGWDASRYQYYEDSYKKSYMPLELVELIRPHLLGLGEPPITDAEIDSLLPPPRKPILVSPNEQASQGARASSTSFGAYIHDTREMRGISPRDFAKLVGVSLDVLSKVETKDWTPREDVLRKIARTLGVDGDDLVARARVSNVLADIVNNPSAHPGAALLLRTTKDLPPDELAKTFQRLREKIGKSKS